MLYFFILLTLWFTYIYVHDFVFIYYYYLSLGALYISEKGKCASCSQSYTRLVTNAMCGYLTEGAY